MDDKLEHTCKETCSRWQQGYDVGKATTEYKLALAVWVVRASKFAVESTPHDIYKCSLSKGCNCWQKEVWAAIQAYEVANEGR